MKKKIFFILSIYFLFDIIITNVFIKKTEIWKQNTKQNVYWRSKSNIYHHDLVPLTEAYEKWQNFNKLIITNSLGYRDYKKNIIKKTSDKKRLYIIGDSFIEGAGYDYSKTVAGIIQKNLHNSFEVLNAGVSSYAAGIYYLKTKELISKGYKIDYALVFLDLSDIYDELFYNYSSDKNRIINHEIHQENKVNFFKKNLYLVGDLLTDNTILFKTLLLLSDKTEVVKNYLKLKYKASKKFNKNFFNTEREDVLFYRMLSVDRGAWTQNSDNFSRVKLGIQKTKFNLERLFRLFKDNGIEAKLIIYPWPNQIFYGDNYHKNIWSEFSKKNKIQFINLYSLFDGVDKKKIILENFILGDVHWNLKGNELIASEILKLPLFKK
jgi:hypothetical protein